MQAVLEQTLLALAAILVSARLLGAFAVRLRQPRVGGEMLSGLLVGAALLAPWRHVNSSPQHVAVLSASVGAVIDSLGQIGVILYLCLVGLKITPGDTRRHGVRVPLVAAPVVLGALAIAPLAAHGFAATRWQLAGGTLAPTLILAAALMVNGFPVVALILEERGMLRGDLGTTVVGVSVALTTLPFLIIAVLNQRFRSVGPTAVFVVGLAAIVAVVVIAISFWPRVAERVARVSLSDGTAVVLAVIVVFIAAWLSLRVLGTALLGGFAAGVGLSRSPAIRQVLKRAIESIVPLVLVPVFFAAGGMRIDPRMIDVGVVQAAALFTILLVAVGFLSGLASSRVRGITSREARTIAALVNCRGLMLIALPLDMLDHRLIGPRLVAVFFFGAVVTTLMTGPLLAWAEHGDARSDNDDDKLPASLTSRDGMAATALAQRGLSSS
jgi:Kef-type K+ transport system membrane component KefB